MPSIILALILMSYPSFGLGRDNLANPTVISGPGAVKDHNACQIIKVRSYAYSENKIYAQEGVGWVLKSTQGTHILLPAHVIAGSNLIAGECGGRSFPLTLKNKSETLDLALLNTPEQAASFLFPLIDLQDRNESLNNIKGRRKVMADALVPEHTSQVLKFAMQNQEMNYYLVPSIIPNTPERFNSYGGDMEIVGFTQMAEGLHSLIVESLAIRPGFSGSPFFVKAAPENPTPEEAAMALTNEDLYYKPYLAGMLTKVEINGSRSLGVSLPKILEALPRLMSSKDADAGRALRLRYVEKVTAGVLERSQEMVQTLSDGSQRIYTEICNDSTAESSEWIKAEKEPNPQTKVIIKEISIDPQKVKTMRYEDLSQAIKDLKDSKVGSSIQRTGGDYGEGGGGVLSLKNATFLVPVLDYEALNYLSSYKIKKNCDLSMIRDNYGTIFDSKSIGGRQVKTATLAELYNALTNPNAGKNSCINASLNATGGMDQFTATTYLMNGTKYVYLRTEGEAKKGQAGVQSITCDGNTTRVNFSSGNIKMDVNFSKSGKAQGYINLTSAEDKLCQVQLNPRNYRAVGNWKHLIRSKELDADIILGNEDRVFSLKILRVSDACSPTYIDKLWMQEVNFSEGSRLSE
ncbi:hypothetical protein ACLVWU_10100 [Bdellovibrio sp. HCB290]|uniref:hypothetical protein n=1 Tax=Bdellovibrio sp. HCB290 TaxID=3394356 RepID=UPI0039B5162B